MQQRVIQIGNSTGIVIPKKLRLEAGLKMGSKVLVELGLDKQSLVISKSDQSNTSLTPNFLRKLEKINKRYGLALTKLAKL